jgi:hypothetical protein
MLKKSQKGFYNGDKRSCYKKYRLGLIAGMVNELEIVKNIDEALPSNAQKKLSYGECVKAFD